MLERRLLIVTGKGGVGKSAIAAALAIRAARTGRRVLAVAMTDPIGLATHFGRGSLGYEAAPVAPGISALAVDRATALDEYLRLQLPVAKAVPTGSLGRGLNVLVDTVPGIRDVVTIGKVLWETRDGSWDLVVADASPTGQIMSYLRAPTAISALVPAGRVREQAAWMKGVLTDPESGLVLVALPEELPVAETAEAVSALVAEPVIDVAAVIVNRVLPDPGFDAGEVAALQPGAMRQAAELHLGLHRSQQWWLERLPDGPRLPYLFGLLTPGEVAVRLADAWEAE